MDPKLSFDPPTYESGTFRNEGGRIITAIEVSSIQKLLRHQRTGRILDVGTGTGRILRNLLDREVTFVGVDSDRKMLEHFARKLRASSIEFAKIDLVVADAQSLPFKPNSFAAVTCIRVARYFRQPARGVDELCSVLEPNGRLVIEFANVLQPRAILQLIQAPFKGHVFPHLFTPSSMRRLILARGILVDSVIGWHKFPPGILVMVNRSQLVKFIANLETLLQRTTPVELLSRSIVISGLKRGESPEDTPSQNHSRKYYSSPRW